MMECLKVTKISRNVLLSNVIVVIILFKINFVLRALNSFINRRFSLFKIRLCSLRLNQLTTKRITLRPANNNRHYSQTN